MHIRVRLVIAVVAAVFGVPSTSSAQGIESSWYAGGALGHTAERFMPHYTSYVGDTPSTFENDANGLAVDLLVGRRIGLSRVWSFALQGAASFNRFAWSLSIPAEPATLDYSLPYAFAVSAAPELHIGSVLVVYADAGIGTGRVRETKTSVTASAYDFDQMQPLVSVGGGVKIALGARAEAFARVGQRRYREHAFDTFTPANVKTEHVTDAPRATSVTVGLTTRF